MMARLPGLGGFVPNFVVHWEHLLNRSEWVAPHEYCPIDWDEHQSQKVVQAGQTVAEAGV